MKIILNEEAQKWAAEISKMIAQNIAGCYQCGKCTAGCPLAFAMEIPPHEIIRLVQLGRREEALNSHTIWLCASCQTCTSRCPKNIDVAGVMDALRILAYRQGQVKTEKEIALFHKLFLKTVERFGRINDLRFMGRYNLQTLRPFRDFWLGQKLLRKGKLKLTTTPIKSIKDFQEMMKSYQASEEER